MASLKLKSLNLLDTGSCNIRWALFLCNVYLGILVTIGWVLLWNNL